MNDRIENTFAAISRAGCPHHIDHLAPLCALFNAPYLSPHEEEVAFVKRFYPKIKTELVPVSHFHPGYFTDHYDVLIHSFPWPKALIENYPLSARKNVRTIFTPHGYSDKQFLENSWKDYQQNDITLLYGKSMEEHLHDQGANLSSFLLMGNLRYSYYLAHKAFFDEIANREIFSEFSEKKPILLYAPSWKIGAFSSSLYQVERFVFQVLPRYFSVVVKLHPWQEKDRIASLYQILSRYEEAPSVKIVTEFPCIYPILEKSDIFLGDVSSVGYDYLTFNRPMFFIRPPGLDIAHPALFLQQYGEVLSLHNEEKEAKHMEQVAQQTWEKCSQKTDLYEKIYGSFVPFRTKQQQLLEEILTLLKTRV
ncbi:MAG: CDP-glycerol glycerophosphotransferase family protein [Chlamydiota bacterium]